MKSISERVLEPHEVVITPKGTNWRFDDKEGRRYGRLVVFGHAGRDHQGKTHWYCKCDCGNIHNIQENHLMFGAKSCGCLHKRRGNKSPFFRGVGELPLNYYTTTKNNANKREILFDVSMDMRSKM